MLGLLQEAYNLEEKYSTFKISIKIYPYVLIKIAFNGTETGHPKAL